MGQQRRETEAGLEDAPIAALGFGQFLESDVVELDHLVGGVRSEHGLGIVIERLDEVSVPLVAILARLAPAGSLAHIGKTNLELAAKLEEGVKIQWRGIAFARHGGKEPRNVERGIGPDVCWGSCPAPGSRGKVP